VAYCGKCLPLRMSLVTNLPVDQSLPLLLLLIKYPEGVYSNG